MACVPASVGVNCVIDRPSPPSLDRHFLPASLTGLLRRGHPYDFADTYRSLQVLYGYRAAYVNLGLWTDEADEPGRALTLGVAAPLALVAGETLVDVGSGLGQGAIDLCAAFDLGRVIGVNPNERQVAFAVELAAASGAAGRVRFEVADACCWLGTVPAGSVHGVVAVECVGHFGDPDGFVRGARHALAPGRRLAFCLNVAVRPPGSIERAVFAAAFGFVPSHVSRWVERLTAAGFEDVTVIDWTVPVTATLCDVVAARLAAGGQDLAGLSLSARFVARVLQWFTRRAVRAGRLGYVLVHAAAPPADPPVAVA